MCARMRGIHASEIRGSVGGNTFFPNQFHQIIIRQRTSPVNPNTNFQAQIRGSFSDASTEWALLTDAQRERWENYAATLVYPGPLGSYTLPGRQVFLSNYGTARYLDDRGLDLGTVVHDGPVIPGFLGLSNLTITPLAAAGVGFSVNFQNPNNEDVCVYAFRSRAFPITRNTYQGSFLSASLDSANLPGPSSGLIDFTDLSDGAVYFVKFRAIVDDGPLRISSKYVLRAVATETVI